MGMWGCMLLLSDAAPLAQTLARVLDARFFVARSWLPGATAIGVTQDDDALDDVFAPEVDRGALERHLARSGVPAAAAPKLADALADREGVLDLEDPNRAFRPITLFEHGALVDVLGELAGLLPVARVRVDRAVRTSGLNDCTLGPDGIARIRLLGTNGTTLAGRTHALVHELGHALIALRGGYRAPYGSSDYGRFLPPSTFDRVCDEEALVRCIADAWLLRRTAVTWSRTWPGAIDPPGRTLDADSLAAFARFRLAQGLGLPHAAAPAVTVQAAAQR